MQVHQLLPSITKGDAISNQALAMRGLLRQWGHESEIYAEHVHPQLLGDCFPLAEFDNAAPDVILYHHSIGTAAADTFLAASGKRIMVYHNITPDHFFAPYNDQSFDLTRTGRSALLRLRNATDLVLGDSAYNCDELRALGYRDPRVLPILFDPKEFDRTAPDIDVLRRYDDGHTHFLFVGRLAPNKRQEDVIRVFAWYHRFIDRRSRLLLVGDGQGMERYLDDLRAVARSCRVEDLVVFTGHVRFAELVAFYQLADVYVSMSEHEGFCVPLLEAMHQRVPIVAYAAAAVPETMGDAGILVHRKDCPLIAEAAYLAITDLELRAKIIERQLARLAAFAHDHSASRFETYLKEALAC